MKRKRHKSKPYGKEHRKNWYRKAQHRPGKGMISDTGFYVEYNRKGNDHVTAEARQSPAR